MVLKDAALPSVCELALYTEPASVLVLVLTAIICRVNLAWREECRLPDDPRRMFVDSVSAVLYLFIGGGLILSQADWSWMNSVLNVEKVALSALGQCQTMATTAGVPLEHSVGSFVGWVGGSVILTSIFMGWMISPAIAPLDVGGAKNKDKDI